MRSTATPSRAIASQTKASLAFGTTFADDSGHALLSLGYTDRDRAATASDRMPFFDLLTPSSFIGQGTFVPSATNLPNQADRQHPVRELRRRHARRATR